VRVTVELPDGSERTLLHIDDWDFNWQDQYRLAQPLRVPAGTTFRSLFVFDNSEGNPRNPSPKNSLEHFLVARRLKPEAPSTAYNVGIALEMLGPRDESLDAYHAASAIDSSYAPAYLRIGAVHYLSGNIHDAIEQYKTGLQLAPGLARARCELARMLMEANQPVDAVNQYQLALRADPSDVGCLKALAVTQDMAQQTGLLERLSLYRRSLPFVVTSSSPAGRP
jgi:tetratricopeptide (TPR) repeat protein